MLDINSRTVRTTVVYHILCTFGLSCLLLPQTGGSLLIQDPDLGVPVILVAVLVMQCVTLYIFNSRVAVIFNPKDKSVETYSRCGTLFLLSVFSMHLTIVLFGAPIFDDILETCYLSLFMALLATFPVAVCTSCTQQELDRLIFRRRPENIMERALIYMLGGSLVGAWFGALPIPLDWDAPWQKWPITCVLGTIGGAISGHMAHVAKCLMLDGRPEPKHHDKSKNLRA